MDQLNYTVTQISDMVVDITLGRVLDNNNAESIVRTIVTSQERGCQYIVVDCTNLEFVSSAGVGAILGTIETSRNLNGDIVLCNLSDTILHVLGVLDLVEFLTIRKTKEEALSMCQRTHSQA